MLSKQEANFMTVGELVALLQQMPQDAIVLYRACSDYQTLRPDEVTLSKAEDKQVIYREENGFSDYRPEWFMTDEQFEEWVIKELERNNEHYIKKTGLPLYTRKDYPDHYYRQYKNEKPNFVTVCCFPGN